MNEGNVNWSNCKKKQKQKQKQNKTSLRIQPPLIRVSLAGANERRLYSLAKGKQTKQ